MRDLLKRLLVATQWGASLVILSACSSQVDSGTTTGAGGAGGASPSGLDPTPEPACYGPVYDGGYDGQCCDIVLCAKAVNGACPSAADVVLEGLPPGSGTCQCEDTRGPYANNDPKSADPCCYLVGSIGCEGRPLLVGGEARLAPLREGPSAWSTSPDPARFPATCGALAALDPGALPAEMRRTLAARWAERARHEHASVASFGRFALSLMALGAPPALLEASHRAALDEIRHARLALSLAAAYGDAPLGFGPLQVEGAFAAIDDFVEVTVGTVIEGCVGETLSALEAQATAAAAGEGAVRVAMEEIAEDEARHAELAWAFVRWALGSGTPNLRKQVVAAFEGAMAKACVAAEPGDASLSAHGFLSPHELTRLRRQAVREVLRPAVAALTAIPARGRAEIAAPA